MKWLKWTARIWGSLIVAVVLLIVIGYAYNLITMGEADPYAEEDIPPIEYSGPVLLFLSTIGLAIAWKWEGLGGGIAVSLQILFMIFLIVQEPPTLNMSFIGPLMISLTVVIPGLLYLWFWRSKKPYRA
jgi:hypothetical protein